MDFRHFFPYDRDMDEELHIIIRPALDADMQAIADAHRASILEIGPLYYPEDVVQDWGRPRDAARDTEIARRPW